MTEDMNIEKLLEGVKSVEKPSQVELDAPAEGGTATLSAPAEVNYPSGDLPVGALRLPDRASEGKEKKIVRPSAAEMKKVIAEHGVVVEPEIAAARLDEPKTDDGLTPAGGYADTYWTHFDFRSDVRRSINRIQAKFPYLTYCNTYYMHPPVFGRVWEIRSVDFWAGGLSNGYYTGYRGKNINITVPIWDVFNAAFNDPYLPNIAWIIANGYMWSRNGGWTSAPWGPAGSDAGHYAHCHISYY